MRYLAAITLLILVMSQPVAAQSFKPDYDAGFKAYKQKDYATALRHWRPLAEQGHAEAQFYLGYMYHWGHGVTKHYKEAAKTGQQVRTIGPIAMSLMQAEPFSEDSEYIFPSSRGDAHIVPAPTVSSQYRASGLVL